MRRRLLLLAIAGSLCGCSLQKSVYWPNVVNAPMLKEKGDVHVSAHGSLIDYQGNVAYAVVPHLEVRAQADVHPGVLVCGDVGVGYFGSSGMVRWELAADIGTGSGNAFLASNALDLDDGTTVWDKQQFDTYFDRAAVQGAVGLDGVNFSAALVLRATRVIGDIQVTAQRKETGEPLEKERYSYDLAWTAIEPALVMRPRFTEQVYGELQLGVSLADGEYHEEFANAGLTWPLIVVVGLGANF